MKKTLTLAALVLATAAHADDNAFGLFDIHPYVGVEVGQQTLSLPNQNLGPVSLSGNVIGSDAFTTGALIGGVQLNEFFAVEAAYARSAGESKEANLLGNNVKVKQKLQTYSLDAIAKLPVFDPRFYLLGSAGLERVEAETKTEGTGFLAGLSGSNDEDGTTYRVGAGAGYRVTENVDGRVMMRYRGEAAGIDHATSVVAGITYRW